MAIGTAAAIGIGLAGVGSALGASSQNKAASKAADVSQRNNDANIALQRQVYGQNQQALAPFMARGNAAGDQLNALLGLAPQQQAQQQQPMQQPNALSQFARQQMPQQGFNRPAYGDAMGPENNLPQGVSYAGRDFGAGPLAYGANQTDRYQQLPTAQPVQAMQTGQAGGNPQADAFETFRNSTGYQFRVNEGMDALNSGYAGAGVLQSGAALKGLDDYRQNMASNEFGQYAGLLANQQGVGLSGASALAGVGQNYANNVAFGNTQNAANQANALTSRQNPFANALGMAGGAAFQWGLGR